MRDDAIKYLEQLKAPPVPFQLRPGEMIIDFEKWRQSAIAIIKADRVKSAHYKAKLSDLYDFARLTGHLPKKQ